MKEVNDVLSRSPFICPDFMRKELGSFEQVSIKQTECSTRLNQTRNIGTRSIPKYTMHSHKE